MAEAHLTVNEFAVKLRRRQVTGATQTAKRTAEILRQLISHTRVPLTNQADALLECVRKVAPKLVNANPSELAVGNVLRRVLHIIREEDAKLRQTDGGEASQQSASRDISSSSSGAPKADPLEGESAAAAAAVSRQALLAPSLHNLLRMPSLNPLQDAAAPDADPKARERRLKLAVIEGINDLLEEIENCQDQLSGQAIDHIHQNQVIITLGGSKTTLQFLKEARRKRSFQAIVAEGAPSREGQQLARELAKAKVQVTLIPDACLFAMMARANLAIVAAHSVLANGGVIAPLGSLSMAMAATRHAVPLVVLAGMFQLSVQFPQSSPAGMLNDFHSPSSVLSLAESAQLEAESGEGASLEVSCPTLDYVPPELVSLLITDSGGHMPSYVYRLLSEYYHMEDHSLSL